MARFASQKSTGVLFAAPARRQRRSRRQADARIARRQLPDDRRRAIVGVIVENDNLDLDAGAVQSGRDGGADGAFLVASGDQHGNLRKWLAGGEDEVRRRGIMPQIGAEFSKAGSERRPGARRRSPGRSRSRCAAPRLSAALSGV